MSGIELRPELQSIVEELAASNQRVLSLDTIAEQIGACAVSSDDIDAIFSALEARGFTIGDPDAPRASAALGTVLKSARTLRAELGRVPSVREIAAHAGLNEASVKLALLFARVAQR